MCVYYVCIYNTIKELYTYTNTMRLGQMHARAPSFISLFIDTTKQHNTLHSSFEFLFFIPAAPAPKHTTSIYSFSCSFFLSHTVVCYTLVTTKAVVLCIY